MSTNYPEIKTEDIRKGDKIRVDMTGREYHRADFIEYTAKTVGDDYVSGVPHYLMERQLDLVNGTIVKSKTSSDYWVRTGKDEWAGFYLTVKGFHLDSNTEDDTIREWVKLGQAYVV